MRIRECQRRHVRCALVRRVGRSRCRRMAVRSSGVWRTAVMGGWVDILGDDSEGFIDLKGIN